MVLKEKKKAQRTGQRTYPELPVLWQLFEETCWFFEIFQKPKTDSYFIPPKKIPSKTWNPRRLPWVEGLGLPKNHPR
jgi:hypothetical protein